MSTLPGQIAGTAWRDGRDVTRVSRDAAEGSPDLDVAAPVPIVPLGINEPADTDHRGGGAGLLSGDSTSPAGDNGEVGEPPNAGFWRQEVVTLGIPSPWKKPLPYLSGVLAVQAALVTSVVVGTFVALSQDHAVAVGQVPGIASLSQSISLAWGPLLAVVTAGVLTILFSATGAWTALRLSRSRRGEPGRLLRNTLSVAVVAQPFALITGVLTFSLDSPAAGNDFDIRLVALANWAKSTVLFLGVLTIVATILALQARRAGVLRRPSASIWTVTALITVALAFFATSSVSYLPPYFPSSLSYFQSSSVGFWRLGTSVDTGLFDRIDSVSCPTQGSCVVVAGDQLPSLQYRWSVATLAGQEIAAVVVSYVYRA